MLSPAHMIMYTSHSETPAPVTIKIASNKIIASVRTVDQVDDVILLIRWAQLKGWSYSS